MEREGTRPPKKLSSDLRGNWGLKPSLSPPLFKDGGKRFRCIFRTSIVYTLPRFLLDTEANDKAHRSTFGLV